MKLELFLKKTKQRAAKCSFVLSLSVLSCLQAFAQDADTDKISPAQKALRASREHDFPITLETFLGGGILSPVAQYDVSSGVGVLGTSGIQASVGVTQINRFVWENFNVYPNWGFQLKYHRLSNKGKIFGAGLYVDPQHDHTDTFEVVPRLGLGIVRVGIPDAHPPKDSDVEVTIPERFQGVHLDALLGLHMKIGLTPHWQMTPSLDFNYLKLLKGTPFSHDLKPLSLSLGLGYIPNPSRRRYASRFLTKKQPRVDVGFLNGIRTLHPDVVDLINTLLKSERKLTPGKNYYAGGLYVRCSIPTSKNHAFALGTECMWDGGAKNIVEGLLKDEPIKIGLSIGHEFIWNKLIFSQDLAMHALNHETFPTLPKVYSLPYLRLAGICRFTDNFFAGIGNKITLNPNPTSWYLGVEVVDFRLGYSF